MKYNEMNEENSRRIFTIQPSIRPVTSSTMFYPLEQPVLPRSSKAPVGQEERLLSTYENSKMTMNRWLMVHDEKVK